MLVRVLEEMLDLVTRPAYGNALKVGLGRVGLLDSAREPRQVDGDEESDAESRQQTRKPAAEWAVAGQDAEDLSHQTGSHACQSTS